MNSLQPLAESSSAESVSPRAPPKSRQRRKNNEDAEGGPSTKKQKASPSSRQSSIIGVTRSISACLRCRLRKTRCDQKFPSCTSCLKANVECVGIDAATGREIPRSYVSHLEDRVAYLEVQLQKHGVDYDNTSSTLSPASVSTLAEPDTDTKNITPSQTAAPTIDSKKPRSDVDKLMASVRMVSVKGASIPPSSYLGSSSGLSFARLLFTAVKFKSLDNSSHATPGVDSSEAIKSKRLFAAALPPKPLAESLLSTFFSLANSQLPVMHREQFLIKYFKPVYGTLSANVSLASDYTTIGVPIGGPNTPCDPDSYYTKHYGLAASQVTNLHPSPSPVNSPENIHNPRPLLDLENVAQPIPNSINPREALPGLYFVNIVFGIATSAHQQHYPAHISESFRMEAMKHIDAVLASPNRLEALQGILLLALYSIMRPAVPGVWYILGSAMRLCVDIGLHNEGGMKSWYKNSPTSHSAQHLYAIQEGHTAQPNPPEYDAATLDLRRRLFWCTYALDRQVCVYLGRPVGIPEHCIRTPFPSELDDALIIDSSFGVPPEGVVDYSREKSTSPSYKTVSLAFFKIRRLQTEIQQVLHDCAAIGRQYSSIDEWRTSMAIKLENWHNECPKAKKRMNCEFNYAFIDLNYHQTRLLLFGLCPAYTSPPTIEAYKIIAESGEQVIKNYHSLFHKRCINYSWVAVHNLFMAGTSYLYALYHSPHVRGETTISEIDFNTRACTDVLTSLIPRCDAAASCRDTFELLTAAILKLCVNEQSGIVMQLPNGSHVNKDKVINTIPSMKHLSSNHSYVHPHAEVLMDSIPNTEIEIKEEPNLERPQLNIQQQQQQHPNEDLFDGSNHSWPEDLDLFFREAAEMDGISPQADSTNVEYLPQRSERHLHPNYPSSTTSDASQSGQGLSDDGTPMQMPSNISYIPQHQPPVYAAQQNATRSDGQRIYEMIAEVPTTAIWDQFFAPMTGYGPNPTGLAAPGGPSMPVLFPNSDGRALDPTNTSDNSNSSYYPMLNQSGERHGDYGYPNYGNNNGPQ